MAGICIKEFYIDFFIFGQMCDIVFPLSAYISPYQLLCAEH